MKEWKNNPGSDDENATDQKNKWSIQEKFEGYQPSGRSESSGPSRNVHDFNNTSDEGEEKQVGRTYKISRKSNVSFIYTIK